MQRPDKEMVKVYEKFSFDISKEKADYFSSKEEIEKIKLLLEKKDRKRIERAHRKEQKRNKEVFDKEILINKDLFDKSRTINLFGVSSLILSHTFDGKNYITIIDVYKFVIYKVIYKQIDKKFEGCIKDSNGNEIKNKFILKAIKLGLIGLNIKPIMIGDC
jgi:hypothetical protein